VLLSSAARACHVTHTHSLSLALSLSLCLFVSLPWHTLFSIALSARPLYERQEADLLVSNLLQLLLTPGVMLDLPAGRFQ